MKYKTIRSESRKTTSFHELGGDLEYNEKGDTYKIL